MFNGSRAASFPVAVAPNDAKSWTEETIGVRGDRGGLSTYLLLDIPSRTRELSGDDGRELVDKSWVGEEVLRDAELAGVLVDHVLNNVSKAYVGWMKEDIP